MIITTGLPPDLISIEDITGNEEEESPHTLVTAREIFYPRVFPRVRFNHFQPDPWYSTTLKFLGPNFPPHYVPFYSSGITMSENYNISLERCAFTQSSYFHHIS